MCGIAGFMGGSFDHETEKTIQRMTDALTHRGPNSSGMWTDKNQSIALGHRRLSILDLSPAGHQPMLSKSGRYVIVFNGEIYNHLEIRKELSQSHREPIWSGHSDTETLLVGIECWGLEATLKKAVGMFAIALWDKQEKVLQLGRDRIGEKPLYYGWQGVGKSRTFLFGSELKAFKFHPTFVPSINRQSLCLLMRHNYIPAPYSIYDKISKLEPGSILTISLNNPLPKIIKYWDFLDVVASRPTESFNGDPNDSLDSLENLMKDSIGNQMISDVPLGAFLSGGIDSSLVVALMQAQTSKPVKTFTIGFHEHSYNEATYAKSVAEHLGTEHTELYVTSEDAFAVIPQLPTLYDEPFSDSSQIPTFLVSQLAKQRVTVCLSGDGGDELFCGYNRYKLTAKLWKRLSLIPSPIREIASKLITSISPGTWDKLGAVIPRGKSYASFGDKIHKGAGVLASTDFQKLYLGMVSQITNPSEWVIDGHEPPSKLIVNTPSLNKFNEVEQMMLLDAITYLPDDILVKFDRAAMGVSLEGRAPFLDHRIVEFAWTLPLSFKLRDGQTKWLLRQLLYRHVPKELIERPKMGFGVPIDSWLRGPLRDWAETLLSEARLRRDGYFHPEIIRDKWAEHLSGKRNWQSQLWTVLMFQAWLENEK